MVTKLLVTTSWCPSTCAQTRVSPRHSDNSFILAGDSNDSATVPLSESFPVGGSTAQLLCLYIHSESSYLSMG